MELDRHHHRRPPSTTSDLFVCFSSRLSKSSMRLSSKSMVSPGRPDKPSLSASLSRRLSRKNSTLQSPMFPPGVTLSKKRGSLTENPEPSSPKVTCIGQVRVKKMKMKMKKAYRARRSGSNGSKDMSFRRNEEKGCLQHRNQRWVHLPVTICDALKAFLNCFSNCCRRSRSCSCGWFVSLHDTEEKRAVKEEEEEVREEKRRMIMERSCSRRRPVFEDLDFSVGEICEEIEEEEEEEVVRVSVSVPPKNALILMRCRSDPVKMSALANKLWGSPEDQEEEMGKRRSSSFGETEKIESLSRFMSMEKKEEKKQSTEVEEVSEVRQESAESRVSIDCREHLWIYEEEEEEEQDLGIVEKPEETVELSTQEETTEIEKTDIQPPLEEEVKTQKRSEEEEEELEAPLPDCLLLMMCEPKLSMEVSKETWVCSTDFIRRLPERHRQHHLKKINPTNAGDEAAKNNKKKSRAADPPPPPEKPPLAARKLPPRLSQGLQPPRSSCSFPIGGKVAGAKDKKQGNAEPLVLTRCKSAPMRSATAKLAAAAPELVCSWKNRKIEPHRPATCGIGAAAGVGC